MPEAEKSRKRLPGGKKLIVVLIAFLLIVIGLIIAVYLLYQSNQLPFVSSEKSEEAEVEELVLTVGRLIMLPDEEPTVATVTDVTQLQNQEVFKKAINGDKVLIFGKAGKVMLYRPSEGKLVEVRNIVIETEDGTISAELNRDGGSEDADSIVSVVVLNGTQTAGLAGRIGDELSSEFSNIEIEDTGNAESNYTKTIVVDVSGANPDLAEQIADELQGSVADLPDGEEEVEVDILIILGQ